MNRFLILEEYFVGGRKINGFVSSLTYASTTYSAFMMVGLVGLAFQTRAGALLFEGAYLAGTILLLSLYGFIYTLIVTGIGFYTREKKYRCGKEFFIHSHGPCVFIFHL